MKGLLVSDCKPIIVTDAGFHAPWFAAVLKQKWDFVGRIRGLVKYKNSEGKWVAISSLIKLCGRVPTDRGLVTLSKTNPTPCRLVTFKGKKKHRKSKNKLGKKRKGTDSLNYAKGGKEPWILATSLSGYTVAKKTAGIYRCRMQIEEGFKDLKSSRYGFSFEQAHSRSKERIEILLLIAMMASLLAWLTGWVAEQKKLHYQFQVNSIRHKRVLSFFLGCQVIKKGITITQVELMKGIKKINALSEVTEYV